MRIDPRTSTGSHLVGSVSLSPYLKVVIWKLAFQKMEIGFVQHFSETILSQSRNSLDTFLYLSNPNLPTTETFLSACHTYSMSHHYLIHNTKYVQQNREYFMLNLNTLSERKFCFFSSSICQKPFAHVKLGKHDFMLDSWPPHCGPNALTLPCCVHAQSIRCEMKSWQTHEMSVYINDKTAVYPLEKSCSIHRHTVHNKTAAQKPTRALTQL